MFSKKLTLFIKKFKRLQGDPHYVAFGVAIGVFVAITPTIPFHTLLAVILAILLRASKPAALLGVWVSNPLTMVFFYFSCYQVGQLFFGDSIQAVESIQLLINNLEKDIEFSQKITCLIGFMKTEIKIFMIMIAGSVILGVPTGLAAYYLTKRFITKLRKQNQIRNQRLIT